MSILRSSMDHRVKPGGDEQRVKPGDDECLRSRDAASHPSCAHAKKSQARKRRLKNSSLKRREAERREAHQPGAASIKMRRAPSLLSSPLRRGPRSPGPQKMERARSPFGAPPRHPRFWPRLGSGRASCNHRMQTGGPSPAPVQRAPRSPARAGRDDAQAARERSVSPRPREPLPLRLKEYPRERRPSSSGMLAR